MDRFAHVKWFVEENIEKVPPLNNAEWIVVLSGVIVGLLFFGFLGEYAKRRKLDVYFSKKFGKYSWLVPLVVRYTTGLLLIINVAKGLLFAPNIPTSVLSFGPLLSGVLAVAGGLLIIGVRIRFAASLMLGVYAISLVSIRPIVDVLDHVEYVGIGLYLLLNKHAGYLRAIKKSKLEGVISPTALLRIFVGLGLMTLALSEKLVGISNSAFFLSEHHWNILRFAGVADRNFIIVSGIVEFLVGLTLVLNIVPRLTTAIVALLMTITAIILGVEEVFGHLFALSLVAIVWLDPSRELTAKARTKKKR